MSGLGPPPDPEGQRNAVECVADPGHRTGGRRPVADAIACPEEEQPNRVECPQVVERDRHPRVRPAPPAEALVPVVTSPGRSSGSRARGQDPDARTALQHAVDDGGRRVHQVLAVVQHDRRVAPPGARSSLSSTGWPGSSWDTDRGGYHLGHEPGSVTAPAPRARRRHRSSRPRNVRPPRQGRSCRCRPARPA